MKRLMAMAAEDARERQYDLMILGGQRQRYNYFGFERAVYVIRHAVMQTNLRHCHGDAEMGSFAFSELTDDCPETMEALQLLFGLEQFVASSPMLFNWLPLPFFISNVDEF